MNWQPLFVKNTPKCTVNVLFTHIQRHVLSDVTIDVTIHAIQTSHANYITLSICILYYSEDCALDDIPCLFNDTIEEYIVQTSILLFFPI